MKKLLLSCAALALLALPAAGQSTPTAASAPARPAAALTPDEQLFTKLLNQVCAAIEAHDMAALGKLMAPEYVHHDPNNATSNRTEELAFISTWGKTGVRLVGPVRANRYGTTAVTVSTAIYTGNDGGIPSGRSLQTMVVWVQRGGTWQMAVVQSKDVPA